MITAFRALGAAAAVILVLLLPACAVRDKTTLDASWSAAAARGQALGRVAIITVSYSEFVQADVQERLATRLRERGVDAFATGRFFSRYTDEERARFRKAVEESGADTILLVRVTTRETRTRDVPDVVTAPGGAQAGSSLDVYGAFVVWGGVGRPLPQADFEPTTVTSEASLFRGPERALAWTAKLRTRNAGSGDRDRALNEFADVVIQAMRKDGVVP